MSKYIKPPASHECKWRSGPPPSVGWWPASMWNYPDILRYWNGRNWSIGVSMARSASCAGEQSKDGTQNSRKIKWTDRWWLKGGEA